MSHFRWQPNHLNAELIVKKNLPYFCSTLAIIGAIVFAIAGSTQIAGSFLVISGLLYFAFGELILETSIEFGEKFPPLMVLSKLIGGKTPSSMKISGVLLIIVGFIWLKV